MKKLIIISYLLLVGLNGYGQYVDKVWEELNQISFEMVYAKSGGRALNIEMNQYGDSAMVSVIDSLTSADTSFYVSNEVYANCLNTLLAINSEDMNHGIRMSGADGHMFTVKYGNVQTNITYVVWAPTYDYKTRKLEGFLKAMKVILSASKVEINVSFPNYFEDEYVELNGVAQSVDTVRTENLRLTVLNNDWENAQMFANNDSLPFSGVMVSYYQETNIVETIVQYKNGQTKNCWSKSYYQNGQIMQELWYGNQIGAEHGKYTSWFENGNLKLTGQYENGAKNGEWIAYFQNGKKQFIHNYVKGEKVE